MSVAEKMDSQPLRFNSADARQLLELLDHIHLVAILPDPPRGAKPHGRYFGADVDAALAWASSVNENGHNTYWTFNYVGPGVGTKPAKDDIQAARGAHVDLDPPKTGEAWDKEAAVASLTAHQLPPSLIIDSGNGVQPVWLLDAPAKDWRPIEAINIGLRDRFGGDDCHNIDRLLRVPGSVNYPGKAKRDRGCVPCLATWVQQDTGQRYAPVALAAAFPTKTRDRDAANDAGERVPAQTGALIAAIRRGDNWHNNMLRLTAHLVAKGRATVEILAMADCLTLAGYTADDTRADMRGMIEDARAKWEYAEPVDPPEYGYVDTETGEWHPYGSADNEPETESEPSLLPVIDFAEWRGEPPARRSAWGDMLPLLQTTMLTGPGGVGKSLLEQMLCTCIALGLPFLGAETMQMNTLYITCEDDAEELWRRQAAICACLGVPIETLADKLHLVSLCGEASTELALFDANGRLSVTSRWRELEATCEARNIRLYAFDNATDAMGGDLNDLHQVAAFVNLLTGLAIRRDGLAMILHHPNKAGDDWLGSVAWHNKVRSRLIIEHGDEDVDPDARIIRAPKANYGPSGGRIAFRWHRGAFVRDEDLPADYAAELADSIRVTGENEAFLRCLAQRTSERRHVSEKVGANYAPKVFATMVEAKGIKKDRLIAAMDRLFRLGAIERGFLWRDTAEGKDIFGLRESGNVTGNRPETRSANDRRPAEIDRKTHPIDTTYQSGAALGPAAPGTDGAEA
ncbi:MAG: AAA family ATPase [Porphyrobacter sp.]|nr:AAA family ATPase [Porphyrobacter sp.]